MKTKQTFKSRGEFVSVAHKIDIGYSTYELAFVNEDGQCVILSALQLRKVMEAVDDNTDEAICAEAISY